jgi:hypothetical protein
MSDHEVLIVTKHLEKLRRPITYHANYSCVIVKRLHLLTEEFTITTETDAKSNQFIPCGFCLKTKKEKVPKPTKTNTATTSYPIKEMVPMWTTSDGREWGSEVEALRCELDIERKKRK